jgi:hypothetical protein
MQKLPAIPKKPKNQIKKQEKTIHALVDLLLQEKCCDDPQTVTEYLPKDIQKTAYRAFRREDARQAKKQRKFHKKIVKAGIGAGILPKDAISVQAQKNEKRRAKILKNLPQQSQNK